MEDKITLTDEEKERLIKAVPYLKSGDWNTAFESISNNGEDAYNNAPIHILSFLKQNRIDLMHKITYLPACAFCRCSDLTELEIQGNVKTIGLFSANQCENLTTVVIKNGVEKIERAAFAHSSLLHELVLPSSIKKIGELLCYCCESLEKITYRGTKEQWDAIEKHEHWIDIDDDWSAPKIIACSDGEINLWETK